MPIKGKIIHIGASYNGTRKSDGQPWKKQEFVMETVGQYPKKVAFSLMNDKIDKAAIQMGDYLEIEVDAQSREYNGKWYTELTAWKVYKPGNAGMSNPNVYQQQPPQGYQQPQYQPSPSINDSDIPF